MSNSLPNINQHESEKSIADDAAASAGSVSLASTSSSERQRRAAEHNPAMRSIAAIQAPQRLIHFEPSLKRISPGRIEPLSEYGRFPSDQSAEVTFEEHVYFGEKSSLSPLPIECRWNIDASALKPHPNDYPVERSSRVIQGADPDAVASRLSKCLQSRSIESLFSETDVPMATCRNTDFVKFYIRLYSVQTGGVLVELQRMCGDRMSFMKDCRALLDAAEGNGAKKNFDEQPLFLRMPVCEMSFFKTASLPPVDEAEPVNMTAGLLASNQSDSNLLGMESLSTLTDVNKTSKPTAILSAKRVLCPEHEDNKTFNIHNYVMSLIIYENESKDNEFYEGTAMEDHALKLRNHAIRSVANSLSLMATEGHLFGVLHSCCDWYKDVFVPKLVQDLIAANEHPHDACYASRCLKSIASTCDRCVDKIKIVGGLSALKTAQEVGQSEFALLEHDAKICHDMIQTRSVC